MKVLVKNRHPSDNPFQFNSNSKSGNGDQSYFGGEKAAFSSEPKSPLKLRKFPTSSTRNPSVLTNNGIIKLKAV